RAPPARGRAVRTRPAPGPYRSGRGGPGRRPVPQGPGPHHRPHRAEQARPLPPARRAAARVVRHRAGHRRGAPPPPRRLRCGPRPRPPPAPHPGGERVTAPRPGFVVAAEDFAGPDGRELVAELIADLDVRYAADDDPDGDDAELVGPWAVRPEQVRPPAGAFV